MELLPHHRDSIENVVRAFGADPGVLGLLLGGSIAHGYARPDSDVDVTIVVGPEELARRSAVGTMTYFSTEHITYDSYVDGKYVDMAHLRRVAERGSDPARYAFDGARVLFSRVDGLEQLLAEITRYPVAEREARMERFAAQLLAWEWYFTEAERQDSAYLRLLAQQKLVLFSCRLVLAANTMLYPYHKWMLRETAGAPHRPSTLMADLDTILTAPTAAGNDAHVRGLLAFYGIDHASLSSRWGALFLRDSELTWLDHEAPIDDL